MATLYELTGHYASIMEEIEANGGELTPEAEQKLDAIKTRLDRKVESIAKMILTLEGQADVRAMESERLSKAAEASRKGAERLRQYLIRCLDSLQLKRVQTEIGEVMVRENPPRVSIHPGTTLDSRFLRIRTTTEPNKDAIREALAKGEVIKGCSLVRSKQLEIR